MSLDHLFKAQFVTGQTIKIVTPRNAMLDACEVNIGKLTGKLRSLPAILCDGVDDSDPWHIVNLVDSNNMLLDHIAIKGAVSLGQAERLCHKYMPQMASGHIRNIVTMTDNGMKTFIDSATLPNNTPFVLDSDAMLLDSMTTTASVQWDQDNKLLSHGGRMSGVMYDMACCDTQGELVELVTPRDIASLFIDEHCQFGGMLDAIMIKNRQFEGTMQKIAEALKTYDHEDLFVKSVTPIEPFKRNGVVNIGAIFTMSDTQAITVLFNNPDSTPSKLTADDILTSWKWMLNKRDVTATLQPRAVESKKYPMIAGRMIKLLARNHDRFKRAQALREKEMLLLNELVNEVESAQSTIATLDSEILRTQQSIDAETVRKQNQTEIGKADVVVEGADPALTAEGADPALTAEGADPALTAEGAENFHANLKEALDQNEQGVQLNNEESSNYSFADGTIKITKKNDFYSAFLASGSVGGEFDGEIKAIQAWLSVRLQRIGEAIEGNEISWDRTAEQLTLVSGDDVLNLQNELVSFADIDAVKTKFDLAKLIVKKLEIMDGWTHNGSTAVRDFVLDETNSIRYKFNVDLLARGKEFRIDQVMQAGELDMSTQIAIVSCGMFEPTRENVKTAVETLANFVEAEITKHKLDIEKTPEMVNALKDLWKDKQNVQMNNEPVPEPKKGVVFKKEAESVYRSIDYSVLDYHGHTSDEFKRANVKGRLLPLIAEAEALLTRRFRDEYQRGQVEQSIINANKMIVRWESKQEVEEPEIVPEVVEPEIVPEVVEPEIVPEVVEPEIVPEVVEPEIVPEVVVSETEQFLNDIISGTADMSDESFSDKLLAIAENLDPAVENLFEQASDAYADYAISLEV